jgi:hypothetical protein
MTQRATYPSILNNSSTPLSALATFTGLGEQSPSSNITVVAFSDVAGTLFIDRSQDNETWVSTNISGYTLRAGEYLTITEIVAGAFHRVRLVNGPDAQTTFTLHTFFGEFNFKPHDKKVFSVQMTDGEIPDYTSAVYIGYIPSMSTVYQDIWGSSGVFSLPTGNESYEVVSDDANDTAAGTGARTILIQSLDANGLIQFQVATLNGTTPVAIAGTHSFPRLIIVTSSGSSLDNEGTITVRVAGAGATRLVVDPTEGGSLSLMYKVPSNVEFHIQALDYHTGAATKKVTVRSRVMLPGTDTWVSTSVLPFSKQSFTREFTTSAKWPPGTIVKYDAKVDAGSGDDLAVILSGYEKQLRQ